MIFILTLQDTFVEIHYYANMYIYWVMKINFIYNIYYKTNFYRSKNESEKNVFKFVLSKNFTDPKKLTHA